MKNEFRTQINDVKFLNDQMKNRYHKSVKQGVEPTDPAIPMSNNESLLVPTDMSDGQVHYLNGYQQKLYQAYVEHHPDAKSLPIVEISHIHGEKKFSKLMKKIDEGKTLTTYTKDDFEEAVKERPMITIFKDGFKYHTHPESMQEILA